MCVSACFVSSSRLFPLPENIFLVWPEQAASLCGERCPWCGVCVARLHLSIRKPGNLVPELRSVIKTHLKRQQASCRSHLYGTYRWQRYRREAWLRAEDERVAAEGTGSPWLTLAGEQMAQHHLLLQEPHCSRRNPASDAVLS